MSDRELLELAAKAAGIVIDKSQLNGGGKDNDGFDLMGNPVLDWHNNLVWNPLKDDGDAMRLAARLHLVVDFYSGEVIGSSCPTFNFTPGALDVARLAILYAAAEIGKAMPCRS